MPRHQAGRFPRRAVRSDPAEANATGYPIPGDAPRSHNPTAPAQLTARPGDPPRNLEPHAKVETRGFGVDARRNVRKTGQIRSPDPGCRGASTPLRRIRPFAAKSGQNRPDPATKSRGYGCVSGRTKGGVERAPEGRQSPGFICQVSVATVHHRPTKTR